MSTTPTNRTRRTILAILFPLAIGMQLFRILTVQSSTGETPFLSANDRSRWCTIFALAVNKSYEIDEIIEIRDPKTKRRTWQTIDMVQHRAKDGKQHFYSSKPPLLSTIYAGVYWLIRGVTGATLSERPFVVARWMFVLVNLLPLVGLWWLMARWADQDWLNDWQYGLLVVFALFGTFLSTFVTTLNNHLPAAACIAISLVCAERIVLNGEQRVGWFALCGLATSFAASNELPALSWVAAVGLLLFTVNKSAALLVYMPALLPVTVAFFATNYLAHGTLKPPYAMRNVGRLIVSMDNTEELRNCIAESAGDNTDIDLQMNKVAISLLKSNGHDIGSQAIVRKARREGIWELWDEGTQRRFALKFDVKRPLLEIFEWGDWYDYPTSYWKDDRKRGVDRGEPNQAKYAFHCLLGHHGIFSLTPFWIVSLIGVLKTHKNTNRRELWFKFAIVTVSMVVFAFYVTRPLEDRNYGGVTSGLRWVFWLVPLWYWLAVRGMGDSRPGRIWSVLAIILLALSVFSATIPWTNPWTAPWISRFFPL